MVNTKKIFMLTAALFAMTANISALSFNAEFKEPFPVFEKNNDSILFFKTTDAESVFPYITPGILAGIKIPFSMGEINLNGGWYKKHAVLDLSWDIPVFSKKIGIYHDCVIFVEPEIGSGIRKNNNVTCGLFYGAVNLVVSFPAIIDSQYFKTGIEYSFTTDGFVSRVSVPLTIGITYGPQVNYIK